jgi:hypothetical protein
MTTAEIVAEIEKGVGANEEAKALLQAAVCCHGNNSVGDGSRGRPRPRVHGAVGKVRPRSCQAPDRPGSGIAAKRRPSPGGVWVGSPLRSADEPAGRS